ncbi:MAG: TolC family protein [Planctomycetota bacterium]
MRVLIPVASSEMTWLAWPKILDRFLRCTAWFVLLGHQHLAVCADDLALQSTTATHATAFNAAQILRSPPWSLSQPLLGAQTANELPLWQAIELAIINAPEIKVVRTQRSVVAESIVVEEALVDWNTFVSTTWDRANAPVGSSLDGATNRLVNDDLTSQLGVTKQNWQGGTFSLDQNLGFNDSNSSFFNPTNQSNTRLGIQYQQPLLQGSGRQFNRARVDLAVQQFQTSQFDYVQAFQQHIWNVIQAYWSLVQSRGLFVIERDLYANTNAATRVVRHREQIDVNPLLMARCEASLARRSAALQNARYAVILSQESLLRLIFGANFPHHADQEVLTPLQHLPLPCDIRPEHHTAVAMVNRPEILRDLTAITSAAISEGVARNQLMPILNGFATLGFRGLRGNNDLFRSLTDQMSLRDPSLGLGVEYRLPIGNRAAKAAYRQARLRIRGLEEQLQVTMADIGLEVRNTVNQFQQNRQQVDALQIAGNLADRELLVLQDRTRMLLDGDQLGPFYVDTLIAAQDRAASAQRDLWTARIATSQATFRLQLVNGTLVRGQID